MQPFAIKTYKKVMALWPAKEPSKIFSTTS